MKKIYNKIILSLLALSCFTCGIYAAAGSSGWTIFNRIQSSQFRALSVTSPGYSDLSGVLYNPAMAGTLSAKQFLLISELGFADDKLGAALACVPAGKGMFSFGAGYYDAGSVDLNYIDNNGAVNTQTVSLETDMMGLLSYERPLLPNLYAGVTLKGATSDIAQRSTASAYAGDIGIFYLPLPNLTVSLALQNYGSSTKFINQANSLPTSNYIGVGYVWNRKDFYILTGAGITNNTQDNTQSPEAGIELGINNISLNFGYTFTTDNESNMHMGVQFVIRNLVIGYAYLPGLYIAPVQRATIGYRFQPSPSAVKAPQKVNPAEAARMPMDMAVAQFSSSGIAQSKASDMSDSLREALKKNGKYNAPSKPDMEKTLGKKYFKQPGCVSADCIVEVGNILNVKQVITGALSKAEGIYCLKVNVVEVKTGKVKHAYSVKSDSLKPIKAALEGLADKISAAWENDKKAPEPSKNTVNKKTPLKKSAINK